jgi:hypothetical protein
VDPRLRAAVDASARWYDDVFALHGIPVSVRRGVWAALGPPPPWHSAAKTLVPEATTADVLDAMQRHERGTVADSFGTLDLEPHGFDLLIDATWLHHRPSAQSPWPEGWSAVRDPERLHEWNARHDTAGVLLPEVLDHRRFAVLARTDDGALTGGAVVHDAGAVAGLSNGWADGEPFDWPEVLACVQGIHPGRPVTDYAWGDDLTTMIAAGFAALGPQRVWLRSGLM